jgi:uncharacterized protein (TIGR02246 family)
MLKSFVIIAFLISSSGIALADSLRDQIEHLEATWLDAYQRGDGKAAAALVSNDVVVINAEGKTSGGGDLYAGIVDRYAKVAKLSVKIDDVQPLGDNAAMATGNYVANVQANKGEWMEQGYWLRVYVREGNAWKVRASSFSVKEPPTASVTVR